MRALAILASLILLAVQGPAGAAEIFRKGPVICGGDSADISSMAVSKCQWTKAPGGGYYSGHCDGTVALRGQELQFTASGEAKRIDYVFPDNDTPLTFDYAGLTCAVSSPRLKTVQNCRSFGKGTGKECTVCAVTAAKVCFNVRVEVTVNSKRNVAASR